MIKGYGYPGDEPHLEAAGAEKLFIDHPKGDRAERGRMFGLGALRKGDTLVMVDAGRIGRGREVPMMNRRLEEMGVTQKIIEVPKEPRDDGRPKVFAPDQEQDEYIRGLYYSAYQMGYVLKEASRKMGWPVKRHHLTYAYGNRQQAAE